MSKVLLLTTGNTFRRAAGALRTLWADESGLTVLGYALLLALTALSALVAWRSMGEPIYIEAGRRPGQ